MGGGSGGGNTTTTQKADPWKGVQPYLLEGYERLSNLYQPGQGPQYFPGQQVADPSWYTDRGKQVLGDSWASQAAVGNQALQNMQNASQAGTNAANQGTGLAGQGAMGMAGLAGQTSSGVGGALSSMLQQLGYGSGATAMGTGGVTSAMNQLNQAGDFQNNPAFQQALQSAIRPVTQQFNEQVMPAIQQGAQAAGQMGGSRQGIAEGIAARGYQDTVGDISANMGNAAYAQGLQALQASGQLGQGLAGLGLGATGQAGQLGANLAGLSGQMYGGLGQLGAGLLGTGLNALGQQNAISPNIQQAIQSPGQMLMGIGAQDDARAQAGIDANINKWNFEQNLPYTMIADYMNMLQGGAGLGGMQTSQQSGGGNRVMGALGGAASGAALGSAFPGIGTAIGAGLGGLYGLFA